MADDKKLIVVLGATGAQGGSVVDALLADGKYRIRGVTRNTDSEKSKALIEKGVEMVKADLNDAKSCEDLFKGAYGAFAVTNFWDPDSAGKETEQGKMLADAAKKAGVQHYIWSTLPNVSGPSKGKYHVPHFDDKAAVDVYIKEIGLPHTLVIASCYFQNLGTFLQATKDENGVVHFVTNVGQDSPVAMYDVRDTGACVLAAFNNFEKYNGEAIFLVGQSAPFNEIFGSEEAEKVLGFKVVFDTVTQEEYAAFGFPGAEELAHMWAWFDEFQVGGPQFTPIINSGREAYPKIKSFVDYAKDVHPKY